VRLELLRSDSPLVAAGDARAPAEGRDEALGKAASGGLGIVGVQGLPGADGGRAHRVLWISAFAADGFACSGAGRCWTARRGLRYCAARAKGLAPTS
jgi:hypothetical protein